MWKARSGGEKSSRPGRYYERVPGIKPLVPGKTYRFTVTLEASYLRVKPTLPTGQTAAFIVAGVPAQSRTDAARKVWERYKDEWLALIPTASERGMKLRRISLHVDSPGMGPTGFAGRLTPIEVYRGP